jgi:hypothetical protein
VPRERQNGRFVGESDLDRASMGLRWFVAQMVVRLSSTPDGSPDGRDGVLSLGGMTLTGPV